MNKEKIFELLASVIGADAEELKNLPSDANLSDVGLGSIQFIQFVVAVEDEFGIEVLDSDLMLSNFETPDRLFGTLKKYFSQQSVCKKVLICDCDNVLWRGIAGEEEIYTDPLTDAFQNTLVELFGQGVLICLCSKNQPENTDAAFEALEMPLKKEHILISKVNMTDKATNIREIADELGLSPDSFVFVDDSPYELDLVSSVIPEVETVRADGVSADFVGTVRAFFGNGGENTDRTRQYREQKEREKEKRLFATAEEFNASLKTEVKCAAARRSDAARIAELSQRTNQFNLSQARFSEHDILRFITDGQYRVYSLSAADKYGDMGTVGAAVVKIGDRAVVEGFFLSCRVFGRGFENVLLETVKSDLALPLAGVYKRSDKNKRFEGFYAENGVEACE